jgi:hypothetical protein
MVDKITKEFQELEVDEIDDELTEEDVAMWGYDSLDDFWESNI